MKPILAQFNLQTRLYKNVLDSVADADTHKRVSQRVNHIKWLAGHICATRLSMAPLVGLDKDDSLHELFGHGNGLDESKDYPPLSDILSKWDNASAEIAEGLSNLPAEALEAEVGETPIGDSSMLGFLSFMMHHEAYHIGQIGILRKYIGKEAMSYS